MINWWFKTYVILGKYFSIPVITAATFFRFTEETVSGMERHTAFTRHKGAGEVKPRTGELDGDGIQLLQEEATWGSDNFVCFSARKAEEESAQCSLNRTGWDCEYSLQD